MLSKRSFVLCLIVCLTLFSARILAFTNDTIKIIKQPKHYFSNTFYFDYYTPGKRKLDTINSISKRLKSYKISQASIGFNIPIITKDFYNKDSTRKSNIHFLLSGNYTNLRLDFEGITVHNLTRAGIGFRGIYNNGKRSIFYGELSPFITQDRGYAYTRSIRLAFTLLYNCSVNDNFAFRVGYTRSFMWGNRFNLPYIGLRFGKIDRVNFSIQFPRNIALTVPLGRSVRLSGYIKPQGGLYSFANSDSLQIGNFLEDNKLYFGRYELLGGLRLDVLANKKFNFYVSSGLTTQNYISFFPTNEYGASKFSSYKEYYLKRIKGGAFINFGLVFRFGKTKSYYNYSQLYNAQDMNNNIDESGTRLGNGNIPIPAKKLPKNKIEDVLDLIDTRDIE